MDPAQYSDLPPADLAARAQVIGNAETTSFGDIGIEAIAAYNTPETGCSFTLWDVTMAMS